VLLACLVCQMGLGCSYVFSPILKHIVADLEWSRAGFAVGSGWLLVSMSLAFPLIGGLAQRFGPRAVLSGCTLLLGGAFLLMSAIRSPWQFYLVNVVLGVALAGLGDIVVGAVASRWVADRRGLALGLIYSGSNFGGALVGVTAGLVLQAESWRLAVAGVGIGAVALVLPFAAFGVREPPPAPLEARPPGSEIADETADLDLAAALRTRSFWLLAFVLFAFYFYYVGVLNHLVAFLTDIGLSDRDASLGFAFSILMGVAAKLGIGGLADRISRKAATLLNFAVLTGASFLLLAIRLPAALPVFLAAQGFATAAENVLLPLMVAECFGARHLERIYGALMLTLLAGALGQIFAGAVFDRLGSYEGAFTTFAVLNLLALGALAALRNERGREELPWT
jgi:MFS family permease